MKELIGTGTALITPFRTDGTVDFEALGRIVEQQIQGGTDYLVVLGTTGESATLSSSEKSDVIACIKEANGGRLPLVLGMGGNNTAALTDSISQQDISGFTALLSVSPYYNKPNQEGILRHYTAVANASKLPVILYNVPGRTGASVSAAVQLKMAEHPNVVATKEASGNMDLIMNILRDKPDDFLVISGDDALTFPMMALGASGVISVVNHAIPQIYSGMVRAALNGDWTQARELHYQSLALSNAIFEDGSPGGIKTVLNEMGLCGTTVRPPLYDVNPALDQRLRQMAQQF